MVLTEKKFRAAYLGPSSRVVWFTAFSERPDSGGNVVTVNLDDRLVLKIRHEPCVNDGTRVTLLEIGQDLIGARRLPELLADVATFLCKGMFPENLRAYEKALFDAAYRFLEKPKPCLPFEVLA